MNSSPEQLRIVNASLDPLSVIACAGSGKTATAIQRVIEMRKQLGNEKGRIALLSFSNVAVDTFRAGYRAQSAPLPVGSGRDRVDIDTLDGFITTNILRPHAYRTMECPRSAFLATGEEDFIKGFSCFNGTSYPTNIADIKVSLSGRNFNFHYTFHKAKKPLDKASAEAVIKRLGKTGAYTYELGRYWCYRVLTEQKPILLALARRYPHIVVDEAQDIGEMHQAILELLIGAGVKISLIGDPHQGIYEFAGANGSFLATYEGRQGVQRLSLTRNFRSLPAIVAVANTLSVRTDSSDREAQPPPLGAFFIGYKPSETPKLIDLFQVEIERLGIMQANAAILCRSREDADDIAGATDPGGQGLTKLLCQAAILRDIKKDYLNAYRTACLAIVALLSNAQDNLYSKLSHPGDDVTIRWLRRKIWAFVRNGDIGLPSSSLNAYDEWQPLLLTRIEALFDDIKKFTEYTVLERFKLRLKRTDLPNSPLNSGIDLAAQQGPKMRADTVHQVKGESIDAVLYISGTKAAKAMLDGVATEDGRIGYVAVTRARNLLWVAIPDTSLKELRAKLAAAGFKEVGT